MKTKRPKKKPTKPHQPPVATSLTFEQLAKVMVQTPPMPKQDTQAK